MLRHRQFKKSLSFGGSRTTELTCCQTGAMDDVLPCICPGKISLKVVHNFPSGSFGTQAALV